jgi:hypothetical protein
MNKSKLIITLSIVTFLTLITLNFTTYQQSSIYTLSPSDIAERGNVTINNEQVKPNDPNSTLILWRNTNLSQFEVKEEKNLFNFKRYTIVKDNITQISFSKTLQ